MAWPITQAEDGTWDWSCFQSAYGAACGNQPTKAAATVALVIAEAAVMERPFPPSVEDVMRADPERFAADYPDPTAAAEASGP